VVEIYVNSYVPDNNDDGNPNNYSLDQSPVNIHRNKKMNI